MGSIGRPTKLTPDVHDRFMQAIRIGATYELASKYAGISYQTYLNWMERARVELERRSNPRVKSGSAQWDTEQPFVEFFEDITRAEGQAAIKWLAQLEKHADVDARWAAWKLERRYPSDYGRQKLDVEHSGQIGWAQFLAQAQDGDDDSD